MIETKITIDDSQVRALFDRLSEDTVREKLANAVAEDVVLPALSQSNYPSPSGKPFPFKSAKQRAFVMAAIRSGQIDVPYRRSGDLGRSYTKAATSDGVVVASGLGYAEFVRGPGQAEYHKGNWDTHETIAQSSEAEASNVATAALIELIGDAGP